jgi:hypothetical protein
MNDTSKHNWNTATFIVRNEDLSPAAINVSGRDRWALEFLIRAANKGCTPIDTPGPRWSAYVYNLRNLGVCIETLNEPHKGPFSGTHARYVLRSTVTPTSGDEVAA